MAYYDYLCDECGLFTESRPMALSAAPCDCPACGQSAPRALVRTPNMALMDGDRRNAFSVNEKSSHAPRSSKKTGAHAPGCSCCSGSEKRSKMVYTPDGAKMAPSARPWMISH